MLYNDSVLHKRYLEAIKILLEIFEGRDMETGIIFGFNATIAHLSDRYIERTEKHSANSNLHLVKK